MKLLVLPLLTALATFIGSVEGAARAIGHYDAKASNTHCYTSFAFTKARHVPTVTYYHTLTAKKTSIQQVRSTVTYTPSSKTTTRTITATTMTTFTDTTVTDTATITSTSFTTSTSVAPTMTITATQTSTVTTTTTLATPSTTSTPLNFVAIQTSLPNSSYKKRELDDIARLKTRDLLKRGRSKPFGKLQPTNPAAVECEVYRTTTITTTITRMGSTTTKTANQGTITSTKTSTFTSTSSVFPPDVTETTTVTTTSVSFTTSTPIASATTTSTTTAVVTETPPTFTVNAQCLSNNFISQGPTAGNYINNIQVDQDYSAPTTSDTTPYDCCVSCSVTANCGTSAFSYNTFGNNICYLIILDQCSTGGTSGLWGVSDQSSTGPGVEWSNGQCGTINRYQV